MTSDNLTAAEYAKSCRESERVHKGSERRVGLDCLSTEEARTHLRGPINGLQTDCARQNEAHVENEQRQRGQRG